MPQPTEGQNIPGAPSTTLKKVLIVEDNPDLRFIFARTFDRRHFSVHVAVDGVEAIESLQAELPDILILDVNMPRLSGFDVLRYVRSNPRTRNIKVVMVTGNAMAMQSPDAEEADLLLIKPINIADLITLAQRLLPKEVL
jgi:CheY-like chemotaxis protein